MLGGRQGQKRAPSVHCVPRASRGKGDGGETGPPRVAPSPGRTTLNGRYAPQVWPGTVGLGGPVLVTPGGLFPLAFRTSVLSPVGTARTLLAQPSSSGGCRSNPSRRERPRAQAYVSVAARPAGKCRRTSSGRMRGFPPAGSCSPQKRVGLRAARGGGWRARLAPGN